MAYLFLDTSSNFKIGVLNSELFWLSYKAIETKRTSEIIHDEINSLLEELSLSLIKLDGVFVLSGPGSYTGMRVAEGVVQVLELEGLKVYSFTTFRLGNLAKKDCYSWIYEAFKGELYLCDQNGSSSLIKVEDFNDESPDRTYLSHSETRVANVQVVDFSKFIENHPKEVFSLVKEQKYRDKPFYFRPLDLEFKKSTK